MSLTDDIIRIVHRATARTRTQVNMMLTRVVVNAIKDSTGFQALGVTGLADDDPDDVEHLQPGGLTHAALPGAEGVMLCVAGSRENPVALGIANRSKRPKDLLPGETIVYAIGATGTTTIKLNALGDIEITPSSLTPKVTVNGDVVATGQVTANGGLAATKVTLANHTHTTGVGPSGPPIIPEL